MVDKFFSRLFLFAFIGLLGWIIYLLSPIVIPFVSAFILAYLLNPLVEKLSRLKLPRWLSISVVFSSIIFLILLATWFIFPILWKQALFIKESFPMALKWINQILLPYLHDNFNLDKNIRLDVDSVSNYLTHYFQTNHDYSNLQNILLQLAKSGLDIIQLSGTFILVPIVTFYALLDWNRLLKQIEILIPQRYKAETLQIVSECHLVLKAFIKGQLLVMILLGMIYGIGLQSIGLQVGLMIGLIAGLASIIPYAGFAVGIVIALLASLFQFGFDGMQLLLVLVVFGIGQLCEGYLLQPFLLGDKIGLSPIAVIFSVLAGAQLAGFIGMIIALPVAAILVVLLHHVKKHYLNSQWFHFIPTKPIENVENSLYSKESSSAVQNASPEQTDDDQRQ